MISPLRKSSLEEATENTSCQLEVEAISFIWADEFPGHCSFDILYIVDFNQRKKCSPFSFVPAHHFPQPRLKSGTI